MIDTKFNILLSFIIPAHNSERTLSNCVESIENDVHLSDISCELIIIENGSEDNTLNIAKTLQKKFANVLLEVSEKGVSKARNRGLEVATGRKIVFVDSDDVWVNGSIEVIAKQLAAADADLFMYGYYKENKEVIHDYGRMEEIFSENIDDFKAWLLVRPTLRMQVWAKVFDDGVIKDKTLRFNEELSYSEDSEFLLRYVQSCNTVGVFSKPIYRYLCSGVSAVRTYNPQRMQGYIKSLEVTAIEVANESAPVREAYLEYILAHFNLIAVHDIFDMQIQGSFIKKLRKMKQLKNEPLFRSALDKISLNRCLTVQLSPEAFIKCHLNLMAGLVCYMKAFLNYREQRKVSIAET